MAELTRGFIGKEDIKYWDGVSDSFSRKTITGGYESLTRFDSDGVDILYAYGSGSSYTGGTIQSALSAIGSTNKIKLRLTRGTWIVSSDLTIGSNITLQFDPGAILTDDANNANLTINGAIIASDTQQIFDWGNGTGSLALTTCDIVHPKWFGVIADNTTDDSISLQFALNTRRTVKLPIGTIYVGTTKIYSYPAQTVMGHGKGISQIRSNCTTVAFDIADSDGDTDVTSKDLIHNVNLHDFTIISDGTGSIGLRFAGILFSSLYEIEVTKTSGETAGSRTGDAFHIGGLEKATQNGNYYNNINSLVASYFGTGIVYGPRAHSNGFIESINISYCDTGFLEDDGSHYSYSAGLSYPVMANINGGAIEQIYGTAIDLNSDVSTSYRSFSNLYIEGCADGIIQEEGRTFINIVRFNSISNDEMTVNGGQISYTKSNLTIPLISRSTDIDNALLVPAFYDSSLTKYTCPKPRIFGGTTVINGTGASTTASQLVTFASIDADIPASIYTCHVNAIVVGSAVGGTNNSNYNVGIRALSLFGADSSFYLEIRTIDGTNIGVADNISVNWSIIMYLP